jgi:myo-inositol-1-phosphate synthase
MSRERRDVLVRMPASLKERLTAETAARGSSLNDVAVGVLAAAFGVVFEPSGRKGASPRSGRGDVLLRMPPALKDRLARRARERRRTINDLIVETLAERLGVTTRKDTMASSNGNGNGRVADEGKVRVALIGVGNCANSLLQGVEYYKDAPDDQFVPGLMHVNLGGYHIRDIEFTAAFDVVEGKVGKDLSEAMWAHPNDTIKFADVPETGVTVSRGMTHDGIGKYLSEVVTKAPGETDDVIGILKETKTDVVVNYLPVGSEMATKWYAEQILEAGCAMVNCMPVFLAREAYWQRRFEERGLPIVGDDIKSQVGATITHRVLTSLFRERGVHLDRTMQLNVGGNSDFLNMLERERLESKKISKTNAVTSMLDYDMGAKNVHVGPSDYVPWLTDRKWAYIRLEGSSFGDVPLNVEFKLEVWDSPNSAGIVIDAVRMAKLALNNGVAGALEGPSSYLMKSPPKQIVDDEAYEATEQFIAQYARKGAGERAKASA